MQKLGLLGFIIAWYFFIVTIFFFTGFVLEDPIDPSGKKGYLWVSERNPKINGLTVKQFIQKIKTWCDEFATEYEFAIIWFCFFIYDPIYMPFFWSLFCVFFEFYKEWGEIIYAALTMTQEEIDALPMPEEIEEMKRKAELEKNKEPSLAKSDKPLPPGVMRRPR